MAGIAGTGAQVLRQSFYWSLIEPEPGRYEYSLYDMYMTAAARANLSVLPILYNPPAFRSARPASGARRGTYPPANYTDFAVFAAALVRRYGPGGEFWRQHPELPQLPIRSWQVWNEPNIPVYWPGGPNPAEYASMLRTVGEGIKAVDPGARVITAGLNDSELGIKLVPFLRGMYRAGAKGSFDVLALHPYAPGSDLVTAQIDRAVRELRRNGDSAHTIVTELGWATGSPSKRALVVSEAGQAALIRRTLTQLARYRAQLRLDGVFYFNWRDVGRAGIEGPLGPPHRSAARGRLRQARPAGAHGRDPGDQVGLTPAPYASGALSEPEVSAWLFPPGGCRGAPLQDALASLR